MFGLFKKVVVAKLPGDRDGPTWSSLDPFFYGPVDLTLAVWGYAIQIYCDFSAYSDIAIGVAALLGYRFQKNFDQPYRAASNPGVLAPLAHLAVELPARLPL